MAKRERFSSVDTAWLRMDRPTNLMLIVGIMVFDRPIAFPRLQRVVTNRLVAYRRFRQRVVQDFTGTYWEDDDLFDLEFHLQRTALPAPAGKAELEHLASELVATPLDPAKPLWHLQLVENYQGGCAIVTRIHHCIADGIALTGVMLDLMYATPEGDRPQPAQVKAAADGDAHDHFWDQVFQPLNEAVATSLKVSGAVWSKYFEFAFNPSRLLDYARTSSAVTLELARIAAMPDDSRTRFKGKPGAVKRMAWSAPLPLDEIKSACHTLGCSVNDLLLSAVAGALRTYLADKGDPVDGVEIRTLVPVNLRSAQQDPDPDKRLGNHFGLLALLLPVGIASPLERLFEVRRRMEELKNSLQAPVTLGILGVVGMAPRQVQQQILDTIATKATAVMTNVPGPQQALFLAGAQLKEIMFWVPQSGDIGMGVSILSYNGRVQFGLLVDRGLVEDPEQIVRRFAPELEHVTHLSLQEHARKKPAPASPPVPAPAAKRKPAAPKPRTPAKEKAPAAVTTTQRAAKPPQAARAKSGEPAPATTSPPVSKRVR
ncbi:MAG: wax ester/triacylglycerol synthase family O-acyltransferase [Rhodocyclaceae bacterium]